MRPILIQKRTVAEPVDLERHDLCADRLASRRRDLAARDAGRGAELGLPVVLGRGTFALRACPRWASTRRPTTSSPSWPAVRAMELCDKLLSYASPLGLYAEEAGPRIGRPLGTFPQDLSHLALLNCRDARD
jgi:hypothetical protein